jgi:hypothetical protein
MEIPYAFNRVRLCDIPTSKIQHILIQVQNEMNSYFHEVHEILIYHFLSCKKLKF